MRNLLKYTTLFLIVANYVLCLFNLLKGEFTHAINEFTIGSLFLYIYLSDHTSKD